jgi:hypothetical protein
MAAWTRPPAVRTTVASVPSNLQQALLAATLEGGADVLLPSPIPKNSSGVTLGSVQATSHISVPFSGEGHESEVEKWNLRTMTVPSSRSLPFFCISLNLIGALYSFLSAHSLYPKPDHQLHSLISSHIGESLFTDS